MDEKVMGADLYLAPEKEEVTAENEISSKEETATEKVEKKNKKEVYEIGELHTQRKANRKVFRMSDNTEKAIFYSDDLYFFNESTGGYEEVDKSFRDDEDGKHYINDKNSFVTRFSKELDDELFSVEKGMYKVRVLKKRNGRSRIAGAPKHIESNGASDKMQFENILPGINFEYMVSGKGVKENIIVKSKQKAYRYMFELECENVVSKYVEQEKRVVFCETEEGKEIFNIPAPFMVDSAGQVSSKVVYDLIEQGNGKVLFVVTADSEWINAEARQFPVIIDPQINISGNIDIQIFKWTDGNIDYANPQVIGITKDECNSSQLNRMYFRLLIPTLPRNPRIKKAELVLYKDKSMYNGNTVPKFGLYKLTESLSLGTCTPAYDPKLIDYDNFDCSEEGVENTVDHAYRFDVTKLLDITYSNSQFTEVELVMKAINENELYDSYQYFHRDSDKQPTLEITYETSYAVGDSYSADTHQIGSFGQGSIDLLRGNLTIDAEDFAWGGNRMPVTIKHIYNSVLYDCEYTANDSINLNVADFGILKAGKGWRLNIMQSMVMKTIDGVSQFIHTDENSVETYYKESTETVTKDDGSSYHLYEGVEDSGVYYDPVKRELNFGGEIHTFDDRGRLTSIKDVYGNTMRIQYSENLVLVTDGAGRTFIIDCTNGKINKITAPDGTDIDYEYNANGYLTKVTKPDGTVIELTYYSDSGNKLSHILFLSATGKRLYEMNYAYSGDRVLAVIESGYYEENSLEFEESGSISEYYYSIASGRTIVKTIEYSNENNEEDDVIYTVYTFDSEGNKISQYAYTDDMDKTGVTGGNSGINPYLSDGGMGTVSNADNLLLGHDFSSLSDWEMQTSNGSETTIQIVNDENQAKFGKHCLYMETTNSLGEEKGIYQNTITLPKGEYAYSLYVRTSGTFIGADPGVYIRVTKPDGTMLGESEKINYKTNDYQRLIVPFELEESSSVVCHILQNGTGETICDGAQLEKNSYANAYNYIINGNLEHGTTAWEHTEYYTISSEEKFNMNNSMKINSDIGYQRFVDQFVDIKSDKNTRETFTLTGWAKGLSIPKRERVGIPSDQPTLRITAIVRYDEDQGAIYDEEQYYAEFSANTDEWQFASVQFAKQKHGIINHIAIRCEYSHNIGCAYFDNIQLVRNSIETDLSSEDFPEKPIPYEETEDTSEEATETGESTEETEDTSEETTETTETTEGFKDFVDTYGNTLTETIYKDGDIETIYRSFGFTPDLYDDGSARLDAGNDFISETDERGNTKHYIVDEDTSRNNEIIDRCGNKITYEYDNLGRTTKVTSKNYECEIDAETNPTISYSYDSFDNMTEIARGDGMKYTFNYNLFHNLESIGIDGKEESLIKYTYKNGNGRVEQMTYANGNTVKIGYNDLGYITSEKWYESETSTTPIAYYKFVYDGQGEIVRSIDILPRKEYNYIYEDGIIVRATESDIVIDSDENIISKSVVSAIIYTYDKEGKLTQKKVTVNGEEQITEYETPEDLDTVVKFVVGGNTVTSHSKTDSFGRKEFDELKLGTGFVFRKFQYHAGKITDQHKTKSLIKFTPTTYLISQMVLSDGRTISYEYDEEERITKVIDSIEGITEYTYDAQGQLLLEKHMAVGEDTFEIVNEMTYDNYGNILSKNGISYRYDDPTWKDRLTSFMGLNISYDEQGNTTYYNAKTLVWEKGRQLKSVNGMECTYNANGIRTSKTYDGVTHTYTLEGTKILREDICGDVMIPVYDNEDSVCGIIYNDVPYYFLKNLQGDVIAITDKDGETLARYTYDAWGCCTINKGYSECLIAHLNPFRYRSYYYDRETQLYYLQSRYYDSNLGMFLNPDDEDYLELAETPETANMFAYCSNDPINFSDYDGNWKMIHHPKITIVALRDILLQVYASAYGGKKGEYKKYYIFFNTLFSEKNAKYDKKKKIVVSSSLFTCLNLVTHSLLKNKYTPIRKKGLSVFFKKDFIKGVLDGCVYPDEERDDNNRIYAINSGWHGSYKKYKEDGIIELYNELILQKQHNLWRMFSTIKEKEKKYNKKKSSKKSTSKDIYNFGHMIGEVFHTVQDNEAHKNATSHNEDDDQHPDNINFIVRCNKYGERIFVEKKVKNILDSERIQTSIKDTTNYFRKFTKMKSY